jgi:uncharacterized delta-60 repeat protein
VIRQPSHAFQLIREFVSGSAHAAPVVVEPLEARVQCSATVSNPYPGSDGVQSIDLFGECDEGAAVVAQSDGKTLIAGATELPGATYAVAFLARLNLDGSPDTSFGDDGVVIVPQVEGFHNLIVRPDGQIFAAGLISVPTRDTDTAVARFTRDGALDPTYGDNGIATINCGSRDYLQDMQVADDGSAIVVGTVFDDFPINPDIPGQIEGHDFNDATIARLRPDGSLDTTFANGGILIRDMTPPDVPSGDAALQTVFQPDGKFVVAMNCSTGGASYSLLRYNPDGSLDTTFGEDGIVKVDFGDDPDNPTANLRGVLRQADGKWVAYGMKGTIGDVVSLDIVVQRFTSDGALDTTFADGGVFTHPFHDQASAIRMDQLSDGRLIAFGALDTGLWSITIGSTGAQRDEQRFDLWKNWIGSPDNPFVDVSSVAFADGQILAIGRRAPNFHTSDETWFDSMDCLVVHAGTRIPPTTSPTPTTATQPTSPPPEQNQQPLFTSSESATSETTRHKLTKAEKKAAKTLRRQLREQRREQQKRLKRLARQRKKAAALALRLERKLERKNSALLSHES